jgi:hypothetical protein
VPEHGSAVATVATRKRILSTAIGEVIVRRDGAIFHAVLHWQGGDHTELQVKCSRLDQLGALAHQQIAACQRRSPKPLAVICKHLDHAAVGNSTMGALCDHVF